MRVALVAAMVAVAHPAASQGLEPYQMVRSLQIVQDRIADGDHAALPMQRELLGIVDERLRTAAPENFQDKRNFNALLIYGASGGNPRTLQRVIEKLGLEDEKQALAWGILHYVRGDLASAREMLRDIEPFTLDAELAAPLALVAGALLVQEQPAEALRLFDQARLLSPGTLVEEAALRRSIAISAAVEDSSRFSLASLQYVRRFLHSPYASQFAEAFVSAVIAMHDRIDPGLIEDVAGMMSDEQAHVIYLRIARQSAIEGYGELLAFASERARQYALEALGDDDDPRATLYASLASVTSSNVREVLETLDAIDARRLSTNDRELLEAAKRIAGGIIAPAADEPASFERAQLEEPRPITLEPESATAAAQAAIYDGVFVAETESRLQAVDALLKGEEQ